MGTLRHSLGYRSNIISVGLMPVSWRGMVVNSSSTEVLSASSFAGVIFTAGSTFLFDLWCSGYDVTWQIPQFIVKFFNSREGICELESLTICSCIPDLSKNATSQARCIMLS